MKQQDEEQMHALYEQWLLSGQSKAVFAQEQGLRATTFYYWAKKIERQALPAPVPKGGFSRLSVEDPVPVAKGQALALVTFPSGATVELYWPVDPSFLKSLLC